MEDIVIVGGGIIGCTTAYYLTRHPSYDPSRHRITLLEATKIAGGASGKAGGLLALWAYPSCLVPLSYRLHAELAREHDGEKAWGYRGVHCGHLAITARSAVDEPTTNKRPSGASMPESLDWVVRANVRSYEEMGTPMSTAQVHPYQFTTAIAKLAEQSGVQFIVGRVTGIGEDAGSVRAVAYQDPDTHQAIQLPASVVVLAAGPWTRSIYPPAPISAVRAHSVTIRPSRPVSAYALFTDIALPPPPTTPGRAAPRPRGGVQTASPEIYARPNNEMYACGEADALMALPPSSDRVVVDDARCQAIVDHVASVSDELRRGEVTARQACYLPQVDVAGGGQGPLIGETGVKGLFMAAGHTCWGIQNGPATGKLVSELVFDGRATSADIRTLDPRRVM
ncbi:MAG: hypothetical protein M1826_002721 [Phylliscum demangeonii]|nr:MAG: hypothetical protein M1826_002721 [Phylliscum demangeonii]